MVTLPFTEKETERQGRWTFLRATMLLSFLLLWSMLSASVSASADDSSYLRFLNEYVTSQDLFSSNYCFILCEKSGQLNFVKLLSERLLRYVSLRYAYDPLEPMQSELTTFVLSLRCHNWMNVLLGASDSDLFRRPYQWILLNFREVDTDVGALSSYRNSTDSDFWNFIQDLPILVDSDLKVISEDDTGTLAIVSPYKITAERDLLLERLGEWTIENGFSNVNRKCPAIRRWNLQGMVMPTALVLTDNNSLNHLEDMVDTHIDTTSKVTFHSVKLIEYMYNITLDYKLEEVWGTPLENGSWTGMVGSFQRKEVEIGASPLFLHSGRLHIVEYYACVSPTKVTFIFISPPLSHSANIFTLPFATVVWVCCIVMFLLACVLLFVTINSENFKTDPEGSEPKQIISLSDVFVYNIGAICLQGTAAKTEHPAGRIITIFTYLAYMFMYISYSAAIVAILQSSDTSIQTLMDLYNSPIKTGGDDVDYSRYYFQITQGEFHKKFYEKKIAPKRDAPNFYPPEVGIRKVREGLFAYHVETSVGYKIIQKTFTEDEKCSLQELPTPFFRVGDPWLVTRKHSPYLELLRIGMNRAIEAGFKTRGVRRFYTRKPKCGSKSSRFLSVGLVDCYRAFTILIYGTVTALTAFCLEVLAKRYEKKWKRLGIARPLLDTPICSPAPDTVASPSASSFRSLTSK